MKTPIKNLEIESVHLGKGTQAIIIDWSANIGFGQLAIFKNEDGEWEVDSECMGEEFVKLVINKWIESLKEKRGNES